jgi:hypothetical protein
MHLASSGEPWPLRGRALKVDEGNQILGFLRKANKN